MEEISIGSKHGVGGKVRGDKASGMFMKMKKIEKIVRCHINKTKEKQIIEVESSDEDDVIEIKLPPPPVVTVADSSDDENDMDQTTEVNLAEPIISRCVSPSSTDDFIGNADRYRLMEDDENMMDENGRFSLMKSPENAEISNEILNDEDNFVSPQKKTKRKKQTKTSSDYQVTQSNFRALDVYESESSDMPESVYAKGRTKGPSKITSSSSDVEEINDDSREIQNKTKKLRKRRTSSNRGSAVSTNDDTSEEENQSNNNETAMPFIERGEAVENFKIKFANNKKNRTKSLDKPTNDTEFVNMLKNIVKCGGNVDDEKDGNETDISNKSADDEEEENITARKIAEEVINKRLSLGNRKVEEQKKTIKEEENREYLGNTVIQQEHVENLNETNQNQNLTNQLQQEEEEQDLDAIPMVNDKLNHILGILDQWQDSVNKNAMEENSNQNEFIENDEGMNDSNQNDNIEDVDMLENDGNANDLNYDCDNDNTSNIEDTNTENNTDNTESGCKYLKVVYSNNDNYIGWNDEMIQFYNKSWGGENFTVYAVKRSMNKNSKWTIYDSDRFPKFKKFANLKCFNCCEFGHNQTRCPMPKKDLVCFMCGEKGHKEPRCPNTICLKCGNKTRVFMKFCSLCSSQDRLTCPICKIRGHSIDFCPDKWRRYHSTTIPNESPNKNVVYKKRKFCCICAGRGHLPENCRNSIRFCQYPLISSEIKSHTKSYQDIHTSFKLAPNVIGYNLFYEPNERIKFEFSLNTNLTNRHYYWRFLDAVGLRHLILRKREITCEINKTNAITEDKHKNDNKCNEEPIEKRSKTVTENNDDVIVNNNDNNGDLLMNVMTDNNHLFKISKVESLANLKNCSKSKSENPLLRKVLKKNFERQNKSLEIPNDKKMDKKTQNNTTIIHNENKNQEDLLQNDIIEEVNMIEEDIVGKSVTITEEIQSQEFVENEKLNAQQENTDEKINEQSDKENNNTEDNTIVINDWIEDENDSQSKESENIILEKSKNLETSVKLERVPSPIEITDGDTNDSDDTNFDEDDDEMNNDDDEDDDDDDGKNNKENNENIEKPPSDFLMNVLTPNNEISKENIEEVSQLPDFIPLPTTDDDDCDFSDVPIGISHRLSGINYEGECTNFIADRDMPGKAKIHLTNFHGKYLLSAEGQKFLMLKCKQHNVKPVISWTSGGNILIINGYPKDRAQFHTDLLLEFRNISEKPNIFDINSKIPKRRIPLIKFIQKDILQLRKNLGNVISIYKQFSTPKTVLTKERARVLRKGRRTLNMILFGQYGLGNGREHLKSLTELLKIIQENDYERVPENLHSEIYEHWKYIFSSHIHDDIHQIFRDYIRMKKDNKIFKFDLVKALGKNAIYVNFIRRHNFTQSLDDAKKSSSSSSSLLSLNTVIGKKNKNLVFNPFSLYEGLIPGIIKSIDNGKDGEQIQEQDEEQQQQQQQQEEEEQNTQENSIMDLTIEEDITTTFSTPAESTMDSDNRILNNNSITQENSTTTTTTKAGGQLKNNLKLLKNFEQNIKKNVNNVLSSSSSSSSIIKSSSFVLNKINEVKKIWENQCENLLNKIGLNNDKRKSYEKSVFWSRECINIIDKCMAINLLNTDMKMKLRKLNEMAKNGELSHNDCMMMNKVYNLIKAKAI